MNSRCKGLALTFVVAVLWSSAPEVARACHCNGHFEIIDAEADYSLKDYHVVYKGFKPDVPAKHFSAHKVRGKGETDSRCRRRARDAAHLCMSAIWRDRWVPATTEKTPECWVQEGTNVVIRFLDGIQNDPKRELEKAACCGNSPWRNEIEFRGRIFKRTYGDPGCGSKLETVDMRFQSEYIFDCPSVRARENCGPIDLTGPRGEVGYDRLGMDLPGMPIADVTSARNCRIRCMKEHRCRAWTWVKPGFQGPGANCWLKSGIPWAKKNECCSSGTVR